MIKLNKPLLFIPVYDGSKPGSSCFSPYFLLLASAFFVGVAHLLVLHETL